VFIGRRSAGAVGVQAFNSPSPSPFAIIHHQPDTDVIAGFMFDVLYVGSAGRNRYIVLTLVESAVTLSLFSVAKILDRWRTNRT
jgi:hypothetical protein